MEQINPLNVPMIEMPSNWGGDREGAGRNKIEDKKIQIPIGVRSSVIEKLGGKDKVKNIMLNSIEEKLKTLQDAVSP